MNKPKVSAKNQKVRAKNPRKTLKRLWSFMEKEKYKVLALWILTLLSTGLGLIAPNLIGKSIDALASAGNGFISQTFFWLLAILAVVYVVDALMSFFQEWLMAGVSQRIVAKMRFTLFEKFQKLPVVYFDIKARGDLMSRFTNDLDLVSSAISQTVIQLMNAVLVLVGAFSMMLYLSPKLTLVSGIVLPLFYILTRTITNQTSKYYKEQQSALGALNAQIEESISGIGVIKAFGREEETIAEFEVLNQRLKVVGTKVLYISGFLMPFMNIINNIGFVSVALAGGLMAFNGEITIGLIISFLAYTRQFSRPLVNLANIYNTLQGAIAGAERYFEVLSADEEQRLEIPLNKTPLQNGSIRFDKVSFAYDPKSPILKEVSFEIPAGGKLALVGATGAGKTTIVNLLCGFYTPSEGQIWVGDQELGSVDQETLSNWIGIVLQDTYLFSGTIAENIRYGSENATDQALWEAAEFSNARHFIEALPEGIHSVLQEGGSNLSQGQRQLLSIARAVLRPSQILVLDEATSNIDTRTEKQVQSAIGKWMKGRTNVVIAHRLSTIRDADHILVLEKGRIVEQGNHESLRLLGGTYETLYLNSLGETSRTENV